MHLIFVFSSHHEQNAANSQVKGHSSSQFGAHWRRRVDTLSRRVLVVLDESSQAKVGDLAHQVVGHQDVSGPQVSVDVVHPLNEGHAVCDLRRRRDERNAAAKSTGEETETGFSATEGIIPDAQLR